MSIDGSQRVGTSARSFETKGVRRPRIVPKRTALRRVRIDLHAHQLQARCRATRRLDRMALLEVEGTVKNAMWLPRDNLRGPTLLATFDRHERLRLVSQSERIHRLLETIVRQQPVAVSRSAWVWMPEGSRGRLGSCLIGELLPVT